MTAINLLLSRGMDVNLDTYTCSPLHIAAQYRHLPVVEILLINGADPNKQDAEKSTPLHALARLCLCHCTNIIRCCDKRKPVDDIIQTLIEYGANIEAQNRNGDRPLDLAVSRFDVQLVKSLLKHGASLENLNEDKMFGAEFTSTELKNYPFTLNIIEMVKLLQSAGFKMSFDTRLKMLKCWIKVRGNNTDHIMLNNSDDKISRVTLIFKHELFFE
ncbi:ankyrin repeat domain-containing protein 27-like [Trichogramma pretiosum]|uniref:ankyrin repeat domain-containing protein 27-like n=1 Tax=Trichogramma pretiosum TaxID=7493 RepID=UPI0006C9AD67|nr:ankyrin repeat domain-containing protein 27-like [Trichogramma pretiosum]XP_023315541.1 ankyrin repeat domain-containing protein 27-like [Trichogramma pretiosum]